MPRVDAGIKNELKVDYKTTRSDMEIKSEVEERLMNDIRIDDYLVAVNVKDGDVTLSGTVDSWSELDDAEKNAFQGGAKDVTNDLVVSDILLVTALSRTTTFRSADSVARSDPPR